MDNKPISILISKEFELLDNGQTKVQCKIVITFQFENEINETTHKLVQIWKNENNKIVKQIVIKLHKQKKNTLIYLFNPHQKNQELFPQMDLYNWKGIIEIKKENQTIFKKLIHTFRLPSNPIIQGDSITDID
jgi:hypothetical protein